MGLLLCLALLATGASAASTYTTSSVQVVKVASDGSTVIASQTVDYRWLQANLPVKGDGSTHYYHQGPTNDPGDLWDPAESKGFEDDDMGALKGTAVRDICNRLVGGMSPGDTLEVIASDGLRKRFSYGTVYSSSARQGPMVLTWYRAGDGNVPAYWSGMKIVFFADTSTNPNGWHVFGISDMRASMPESEWYYKLEGKVKYPSTTGLAVRYVKELRIHSTQAAKTAAPTVAPTKAPTPTATPTGSATGTTTTGGTGVPTTSTGTTAIPATTAPAVTTLWPDNDGGGESVTPAPSDSIGPGIITTTPTSTATPAPVPNTTGGANVTPNETGVPSPTADATANQSADATLTPVPTTYEQTYEYSVSPEFGYSVVDDAETTATTATPAPTPSPDPTATATGDPSTPVVTTVEQAAPTTPAGTAGTADRSFNRSVSFTFSVRVRESGDPALAADGALGAWLTAFLRAFAYIAGAFLP